MAELEAEGQISTLPPAVLGGMVIVPMGLLVAMSGGVPTTVAQAPDTQASAARARAIVMNVERQLGYEPVDGRWRNSATT